MRIPWPAAETAKSPMLSIEVSPSLDSAPATWRGCGLLNFSLTAVNRLAPPRKCRLQGSSRRPIRTRALPPRLAESGRDFWLKTLCRADLDGFVLGIAVLMCAVVLDLCSQYEEAANESMDKSKNTSRGDNSITRA
jgi:hypothetical protein